MVEIGAGGGSVAALDDLKQITVGPESAGSDPGPACYDRGNEHATVTDADLVLGRIEPATFAGGKIDLAPDKAETAITTEIATPLGLNKEVAAAGIDEIVNENMANAARVHAIEHGKDTADRTLVAFGGAAPLHAARLADKLGIDRVIVPTAPVSDPPSDFSWRRSRMRWCERASSTCANSTPITSTKSSTTCAAKRKPWSGWVRRPAI